MRSRHYEEQIDGRWVEDLGSDIGRIARQQDFIRRALSRAIDRGARNPGTLDQLIDVGLSGITVDSELTADDIFDLGTRFRSFDPDSLTTYSLEGTPDTVGEAAILRLVEGPETDAVLSLFRGGDGRARPRRACSSPCATAPARPGRGPRPPPPWPASASSPPWPATSWAAGPTARWCATRPARRPPPTSWPAGSPAAPASSRWRPAPASSS